MSVANQNRREEFFELEYAELIRLNPIKMDVPFSDSSAGPFTHVNGSCWMNLYSKDGIVGGAPVPGGITQILPLVLTGKKEKYGDIFNRIFWKNRNNGGFTGAAFSALGALDLLFNDILAQRSGLPLHRYWGATRDWVHVYASGHGSNVPIEDMIAEAESFKARGYKVYKMKIGTNFGTEIPLDVERVRIMREVIGPEGKLAIDANQIWTADEAMDFFRKVEQYDIFWYEEPVHSHELAEIKKICELCPVPVSMGESLKNRYFFPAYLDAGVGQIQANPPLMGYDDWSAIRDMTYEREGVMFSGGGVQSTAFLATAHEDCHEEYLQPRREPVLRCMGRRPEERDGKFFLPSDPGLPIKLDMNYVKKNKLLGSVEYFWAK